MVLINKKGIRQTNREYIFIPLLVLFLFTAAMVTVKRLFFGLDIDEQYAVTLAYRIAKGDMLLKEIWEPHQTSALIMALPVWIFIKITDGTAYLGLFLRLIGIAIQTLTAMLWFTVFRGKCGKIVALSTSFLVFLVLPKLILSPEFNNMQIWFFVISVLFIVKGLDKESKSDIALAGAFLFLEILAYPTCILVYISFVILMFVLKRKYALILALPALIGGILLGLFLALKLGVKDILFYLSCVLDDGAHSEGVLAKLLGYIKEIPALLLHLLAFAALAALACALVKLILKEKGLGKRDFYRVITFFNTIAFVHQIISWLVFKAFIFYPQYAYVTLFISGIVVFIRERKELEKEYKYAFLFTYIGNVVALLSILMLTNLNLKATFIHLIPADAVAVILICEMYRRDESLSKDRAHAVIFVFAFIAMLFVNQGVLVRTSDEGRYKDVFLVRQKVLSGPGNKIYAAYMEGYELNEDETLLKSLIPDGAKVLYIGNNDFVYMIGDYEIASPSVISTPTFGENLIMYYEVNPEKIPEYIVVKKGYLKEEEGEFVGDWMESSFKTEEMWENEFVSVYKVLNS